MTFFADYPRVELQIMVTTIPEHIVRIFQDGLMHGNYEALHQWVHPEYIDHGAIVAKPGIDGFKRRMQALRDAFSEINFKVSAGHANDGFVSFAWELNASHTGIFIGLAGTGRRIAVSGLNMERLEESRIVEHWSQFDALDLKRQLTE